MKKCLLLLLLTLILILPGTALASTIIYEDNFTDLSKVDTAKTTAVVDTADKCVRLPMQSLPNAIAMNKYGDGYAVVTKTGVQMYEYDDSTGKAMLDNVFSVPFVTDAIGVAIRQDNLNMWAITDNGVQYCRFNGSGMADDPALKASGIGQVLSVDAWENTDKAVVLLNNGGSGQIKIFDGSSGSLANSLTVNTSIPDPVAVSVVKGTADLRVATKDTLYYLAYDDAAGTYVEDPSKKITGFSGLTGLSSDRYASAVNSDSDAQLVFDDDAGGGSAAAAYSIGTDSNAYAISLKPGSYDQAVVTEADDVQYWRYDDASGGMVRDSSMEVTGLQLTGGYLSPREYFSKVVATPSDYDQILLTVTQDIPAGTSISYWISSDGGSTFTQVNPNTWSAVSAGHNFVVKAVLNTTDKSVTPKILYIKLEATTLKVENLTVTAIAKNNPSQILPTTSFPVEAKAGADVLFEVTTEGFADSVTANFTTGASVILTNKQSLSNDVNVWWGDYVVPIDAVDPSSIGITVTAYKGAQQKQLTVNPFINVRGNITDVVDLTLIQ